MRLTGFSNQQHCHLCWANWMRLHLLLPPIPLKKSEKLKVRINRTLYHLYTPISPVPWNHAMQDWPCYFDRLVWQQVQKLSGWDWLDPMTWKWVAAFGSLSCSIELLKRWWLNMPPAAWLVQLMYFPCTGLWHQLVRESRVPSKTG